MKYPYSLLFLFFSTIGFAQYTVTGIVVDKHKQPLHGVKVLLKGTDNYVNTDEKGNYKIEVFKPENVLIISFSGYVTYEITITSDKFLEIELQLNSDAEIICSIEFKYANKLKIGYSYGFNKETHGVELHSFIPKLFRSEMYLKYRTASQNEYLNFRVEKRDFIHLYDIGTLGGFSEYKSIDEGNTYFREFTIAPKFYNSYVDFSLGYTTLVENSFDGTENQRHGLNVELSTEIKNHLDIDLRSISWGDFWQYRVNVQERLFGSKFYINAGWEKIDTWEEWDVSLMYKFIF